MDGARRPAGAPVLDHCEADAIIPAWLARRLVAKLPTAMPRFLPDESHYSLPLGHLGRILGEITR